MILTALCSREESKQGQVSWVTDLRKVTGIGEKWPRPKLVCWLGVCLFVNSYMVLSQENQESEVVTVTVGCSFLHLCRTDRTNLRSANTLRT